MNLCNFGAEQRCNETSDDWLIRVGHRFINLNYLRKEDEKLFENSQLSTEVLPLSDPRALERSLLDIIEENPINSFDYVIRESVKNKIIIPKMALYLSARTIETICDKIFLKRNINDKFVELIYEYFFSAYLKRIYSWSSLHMLIKASKAYPEHFKRTISVLFRDTSTPNNILLDYVENLNAKDCTNLIKYISQFSLTSNEFDHNLRVLCLMYKKSDKDEHIFQFIYSNLEVYNEQGAYSKQYGRLLLCFIENLSGFNVRVRVLKKIIENHFTPYKKPCIAALEKFVMDILALQMNFQERPRIVIPRPTERFQL